MNIKSLLATVLITTIVLNTDAQTFIGKQTPEMTSDRMTPEVLWSMGRIGTFNVSPDGSTAVYTVTYYSVEQNKSHSVIYVLNLNSKAQTLLTTSPKSEYSPVFIKNGQKIAYLTAESGTSQLWEMNVDGTDKRQISFEKDDISEFLFSPDEKQVILIKEVETDASIAKNDSDLPKASGMVINDLMYKHWDTYVKSIPHPFVARFNGDRIEDSTDILEGEPYECPMMPFGGIEQLSWSPDSKSIAYTCRKKTGKAYAISTDSDIFLYDIATKSVKNLCKQADWTEQPCDTTMSLEHQAVNHQQKDNNVGYDQNPAFSPDGQRIAWLSMERDGYESDLIRLMVMDLTTGERTNMSENFDYYFTGISWSNDDKEILGVVYYRGTDQVFACNLATKEFRQITYGYHDIHSFELVNGKLYCDQVSMQYPSEIYVYDANGNKAEGKKISAINDDVLSQVRMGKVEEHWIKTVDGKDMLTWLIYPYNYDSTKTYPALLYCEGGPQSEVGQFWSTRWNFMVMSGAEYFIIAPNRRGTVGFGQAWTEEISGDYGGLCMQDYMRAADFFADSVKQIDKERLGACGASFGGYSVYWLAGHNHDVKGYNDGRRFKAFLAHNGMFNFEQQYLETEEMWFDNWDIGGPYWDWNNPQVKKSYANSPHLFVDKWNTPICVIHSEFDFRIVASEGMAAYNAAQMRHIPSRYLYFPDETHWVLKPQNSLLWHRNFIDWFDTNLR